MNDILTFNQSIFGTKFKERGISKRAKKAQMKELYTPSDSDVITYDEGYDIDGGAFLQVAGFAGFAVSVVCNLILKANDMFDLGINWFWKGVLNITAFVGTVFAIAGNITGLAAGENISLLSTIFKKIGCSQQIANALSLATSIGLFFNRYLELSK